MGNPDYIEKALLLPSGARFFKCDLHMQTPADKQRWLGSTMDDSVDDMNAAALEYMTKCYEIGLEAIAITDHNFASKDFIPHLVNASKKLKDKYGYEIVVFPGFEIEADVGKGCHVLAIFEPTTDLNEIDHILTLCGVPVPRFLKGVPKRSTKRLQDILDNVQKRNTAGDLIGIVICPHSQSDSGIFDNDKISEWLQKEEFTNPDLFCIEVPKPPTEMSTGWQNLFSSGEDCQPEWKRNNPIACIMSSDTKALSAEGGADNYIGFRYTHIKMSEPSIEGLRQAFLDPHSRIRFMGDPRPDFHSELVAINWQGGFLDGASLHFNENLNVLIGGRGTGKSTVIESIRHVLELSPLGDEAGKIHKSIVDNVLIAGTKISILVRSYYPSKREYLVERTIPGPPLVKDADGNVLDIKPTDAIPSIEIFGQHEISEITKSKEKLTNILKRFVIVDEAHKQERIELIRNLESSRNKILESNTKKSDIEDRLSLLPTHEETLKRYSGLGIEEKLSQSSQLVKEKQFITESTAIVETFSDIAEQLAEEIESDFDIIDPESLSDLGGKAILKKLIPVMNKFNKTVKSASDKLGQIIESTHSDIETIEKDWERHRDGVQKDCEKILLELQESKIDGYEYILLKGKIAALKPLKKEKRNMLKTHKELLQERTNMLSKWEDLKAEEFRQLQYASISINIELEKKVRVSVEFCGNRKPLYDFLRNQVGGRVSQAIEKLDQVDSLSLTALSNSIAGGKEALMEEFEFTPATAENIASVDLETKMKLDELDLPPTTKIELNVAQDTDSPVWQKLEQLSTGQKATAILLLLLLESNAPLIVDQPEDDLDNRFITEGIVPKMKEEKNRRQFVFATHNANIPVLGDAELIAGLAATGEAGLGKASLPIEKMGSIDSKLVRIMVEEILEGGKEAFEMRRMKYGF